jgi:ankyrin repeat protein
MEDLREAIEEYDLDRISQLVEEAGVDVNQQNAAGNTVLFFSDRDLILYFLMMRADPDIQNNKGETALMHKITIEEFIPDLDDGDRLDIMQSMEALLDEGQADPNIKDNNGNTALILATAKNAVNKVNLLLKYKAGTNLKNNDGHTALMFASSSECAKALLDAGAHPNAKDNEGNTALYFAAKQNRIDVVKQLFQEPTLQNLKIESAGNKTVVQLAEEGEFTPTMRALILKQSALKYGMKDRRIYNRLTHVRPGNEGNAIGTLKRLPENVLRHVVAPYVGSKGSKKGGSRTRRAKRSMRRATYRRGTV